MTYIFCLSMGKAAKLWLFDSCNFITWTIPTGIPDIACTARQTTISQSLLRIGKQLCIQFSDTANILTIINCDVSSEGINMGPPQVIITLPTSLSTRTVPPKAVYICIKKTNNAILDNTSIDIGEFLLLFSTVGLFMEAMNN